MLPSARCAGQVHPRIAFALGLKPGSVETRDFSGNTAPGTMAEEMEVGWGLGGPLSPPCLVFELSEAFGPGISHPRWAGGLCVALCLQ